MQLASWSPWALVVGAVSWPLPKHEPGTSVEDSTEHQLAFPVPLFLSRLFYQHPYTLCIPEGVKAVGNLLSCSKKMEQMHHSLPDSQQYLPRNIPANILTPRALFCLHQDKPRLQGSRTGVCSLWGFYAGFYSRNLNLSVTASGTCYLLLLPNHWTASPLKVMGKKVM